MHDTAHRIAGLLFSIYWRPDCKRILEIGSRDYNGSVRDFCPEGALYVGIDVGAGSGVDIISSAGAVLPFRDASFDVVIASSVFEHDDAFWDTFLELCRVLRGGGYVYLNAPSNGVYHRYPTDNWRFYPDAGLALEKWAKRRGFPVKLVESFIAERENDIWNDFVGVFTTEDNTQIPVSNRIADHIECTNVLPRGSGQAERRRYDSEDMVLLTKARDDFRELGAEVEQYRIELEKCQAERLALKASSSRLKDKYLRAINDRDQLYRALLRRVTFAKR
jgi:SAM-dependent methyltransferase